MNLKCKLALSFMLLLCITAFAQETRQGVVTSVTDDMPLPGVNVIIEGTSTGVSTDFNGNFQIEASEGDVLKVSYVGYISKLIPITSQSTYNVSLEEDFNSLDEVVIVGYGTRKKSHLTGAIAKVSGEDVAAIQAPRVDDALAGKLPGVLIQNQSGEPGADPKIQIRAAASVTGDSSPLIVVDGYPISGNLATVNPNDIQSLEVLKDAASAAIYGSRGANGVILVTTKKGKTGKASFSYNTFYSTSSKYRGNILPTSREWDDTIEENVNNGSFDLSGLDQDLLSLRRSLYRNSPDVVAVEDWLFQSGSTLNHDLSMSGGTDSVNYFASIGYQDTEGVAITQGFERINARLNIDAKLGDKFKTGVNFNGFTSKRDILAHRYERLIEVL